MTHNDTEQLDPRRWQLCGRANADRLALQLSHIAGDSYVVVRTGKTLQPYKVIPSEERVSQFVELEVVVF